MITKIVNIYLIDVVLVLIVCRGVATKFRLGVGGGVGWRIPIGAKDLGESKRPTPKLFLLGFRPLYFGNIAKSKYFGRYSDFFSVKISDFW